MAKVVRVHAFGGPEVLQLDEVDVGEPGAGEVRLRVGAFGLNRVETMYRSGNFGEVRFPAKIGYEAAGVVEAIGPGVEHWIPGDRVAVLFGNAMEQYGTYGEQIIYPADMLVAVPKSQSLVEAAASWMMYGTAYALVEVGNIAEGDVVVITAASSSVGIAAIQIANRHNAIPIAVTRGRSKVDALKACGAAHVIVSDEENVATRIVEITGGRGARIVFDAVAGPQLAALASATQPHGIIIVYGLLAGHTVDVPVISMMMNNLTLRGFAADYLIADPKLREKLVSYINAGLANETLSPVIDKTFELANVSKAHSYMESSTQVGKIVVTTPTANE